MSFLKQNVAVVGATGAVGRAFLSILEDKGFPPSQITALASDRSRVISYGTQSLSVSPLASHDFSQNSLAFFSAGSVVSENHAPRAVAQGCLVIDNTSCFRMNPDVPLVIPEVNGHLLSGFKKGIIANPNCSTIQLLMALAPLHRVSPISRVVVCTYQSTSGAGQGAMDELFTQTKGTYVSQAPDPYHFSKPIAFNVIPHIDHFMPDGQTKEEWKMAVETQKILDPTIRLVATCVRVPVFVGHAVAAHVEFTAPLEPAQARKILRQSAGVCVMDNPEDSVYCTPLDCVGEDGVFVSRIRRDPTVSNGLSLWIVADNVRKGAALNAIQIAERVCAHS